VLVLGSVQHGECIAIGYGHNFAVQQLGARQAGGKQENKEQRSSEHQYGA
jgi:hypothetical protein